jgi:hypothetical protein
MLQLYHASLCVSHLYSYIKSFSEIRNMPSKYAKYISFNFISLFARFSLSKHTELCYLFGKRGKLWAMQNYQTISTGHHFQNGHHNTAQIQHCSISMSWIDSWHRKISTRRHFQNGRHNTAKIDVYWCFCLYYLIKIVSQRIYKKVTASKQLFKCNFGFENYLSIVRSFEHRKNITKLRISAHIMNWSIPRWFLQKKKFFRAIICSLLIMGKNIQDFQDDANIQAFV